MTNLSDHSNESNHAATLAANLLHHYSFELTQYTIDQQVNTWLDYYPEKWLPIAIIEALYQGRYKAISVEQILNLWQRREQPIYHYNHEFERLVCGNLPRSTNSSNEPLTSPETPASPQPALSYRKILQELPSIRAASRLERLSEIPSLKLALMNSRLIPTTNLNEGIDTPTGNGNSSEHQQPVPAIAANVVEFKRPSPNDLATNLNVEFDNGFVKSDREFQEFKEGVVFGLSSGLAVCALNPRFRLELSRFYNPNWVKFFNANTPIDQFLPEENPSEFHTKLKTVVQPDSQNNEERDGIKNQKE